ncbi:TonB-dependent receptor [Flavivirga amylovorans]|uniref:TonB-dependent receptor n=1 Tax=Flavivirga amylovorans TaxID=870486 RepID=A0ABT8X281_9FLAO|nr:TonB-dependent receptor [Flavivirga amylovorans]MDO5988065.1 TonB-dependent receptor [Flavivirga amylovorans]
MKTEKVFEEIEPLKNNNIDVQKSISGTITDANGAALPGANIIVKGTSNGAQTDFDGKYTISNVGDNDVLIVSYVGFISQEIAVNGRTTINISLEEDTQSLSEIVVVAYGTATKKDLTGAVSVVSTEDLNSFPATTVDQALQGKTSGVQITADSGAPGSSVSVNIRGVGSFGSTTPLYVVDGFPTQNISFLNPNNIESLTVLKDASATALYGVRASNGVVIIETKKGRSGKVQVEINSFLGFRSEPEFVDVLDVNTFAPFALELSNDSNPEVSGTGVPYSGWSNPSGLRNVNWQDAAFNSAVSKSTTVSVRGGGEKARLAFTAGIFDQEGTVVGSEYKRYDLGFNAQFDISDKLRLKANTKYIASQSFQPLSAGRGNLLQIYSNIPHLAPIGEVNLNGDPNLTDVPVDGNGNFGAYPDEGSESLRDSRNVIAQGLERDQDNINNSVLANMNLEYDIVDGLSSKLNFGARTDNFSGWTFNPQYYRSINNLDVRNNATFNYNSNTSNQWLAEFILEYNKTFADKHKISVLAGTSAQRTYNKFQSTTGSGFLNNEIRDISQASNITNASGASTRQTLASTFARLNYSFDSKYYITGTIRRDGVGDQFTKDNFWGVFPSVALGWNIDEEAFMDDSTFDILKFRASWGETGNFAGIQPFSFLAIYNNGPSNNTDASYSFGGVDAQGLIATGLPNPELTWETQIQTNIGFEGELLDNRLYFTLDWFKKESSDFLFNETIPVQSGFSTRAVNAGNVVNEGFEFLMGYKKNGGDFTYDISANITSINNEITELTGPGFVVFTSEFLQVFNEGAFWYDVTRSEVGGEVGSFYGFVADGIFQTQAEVDALNANAPSGAYQDSKTTAGDRRFADLNGDGEITGEDRTTIGSPVPDFYGSLNLNFAYKNFDLGLEFYGVSGNEVLNIVRRGLESPTSYGTSNSFSNVGTDYYNNRWTPTNPSNIYARALLDDNDIQNNRASSHFVEDGSFLRLRNLNFGYSLPDSIIDKLGLSALRIYLSAQNVITWTKYNGSDPEVGQNTDVNGVTSVQTRGIDAGAYPISSSVTLGLNLKF